MTDFSKAQLDLIEKHRDWNVEYLDWFECTISDFVDVALAFGIDTDADNVQFSGFGSQGDGASFTFRETSMDDILQAGIKTLEAKTYGEPETFTGYVKAFYDLYLDVEKIFAAIALTCPDGREMAESVNLRAVRTGHYYSHSNTVTTELSLDGNYDQWDHWNATFPDAKAALLVETRYGITLDSESWDKMVKECADELFSALRAEYEYRTSDEQVWEALQANDIDVEEDAEEDDEELADA